MTIIMSVSMTVSVAMVMIMRKSKQLRLQCTEAYDCILAKYNVIFIVVRILTISYDT